MFAGHYAPALALRRIEPGVPLWAFALAVQGVDVGFFTLSLAGVEGASVDPQRVPRLIVEHGEWTHSVVMTLVWVGLVGLVGILVGKARAGGILALAVLSHWLLDLVVHSPDLPLAPWSSPKLGLGLWSYPLWAYLLEVALLIGSTALWARVNRRVIALGAALVLLQTFDTWIIPSPTDPRAVAVSALGIYGAVVAAAWWVERPSARP